MEQVFRVLRPCADGQCPCTNGLLDPCDCSEPLIDVDVDELTAAELDHFWAHGTGDQRDLIARHAGGDRAAELLAGQRDVMPELARTGTGGGAPSARGRCGE